MCYSNTLGIALFLIYIVNLDHDMKLILYQALLVKNKLIILSIHCSFVSFLTNKVSLCLGKNA